MKNKDKTHIINIFKDALRKTNSCTEEKDGIISMYDHLFSMLTDKDLEWQLKYLFDLSEGKDSYFKKDGKKSWFYIFHKSIRQCDFFKGCYQKVKYDLISDAEKKEYLHLFKITSEGGYKKEGTGKAGELFNPQYKRYLELWNKKRRETKEESIGGHIDMLLWNLIHVDKDGVLSMAFKRTFTEYKIQNTK